MGHPWVVFVNCGWAAWIILLLTIVGTVVGVVALGIALMGKRVPGIIAGCIGLGIGLFAMAGGPLGRTMGMARCEGAVSGPSVSPQLKARILVECDKEASGCIQVAMVGLLPVLLSAGALAAAMLSKKK